MMQEIVLNEKKASIEEAYLCWKEAETVRNNNKTAEENF